MYRLKRPPSRFGLRKRLRAWHKHPVGWPLALFMIAVFVGVGAIVLLSRHNSPVLKRRTSFIVIVSHDGHKETLPTNEPTVGALLSKLNLHLTPRDRVEPAAGTAIVQDNLLINVYRAEPVQITDGGTTTSAYSAAATPRGIVTQAGMQLYPEDTVSAEPVQNFVSQGGISADFVVHRATPVFLSVYSGDPVQVRTQAKTVGELLKSTKVVVTKADTVKPAADTPIQPGMLVSIVRNGIHVINVQREIPSPQQIVIDRSLSFGTQVVRQQGSPGKETDTYQVNVQHGDEISRTLLQSVVTVQPVPTIIAKGNTVNIPSDKQAVMAAAGVNPGDYGYVDYIFSHESHWNSAALNGGGCAGLGQACPGSKLAAACPNWQGDPVCQTRFFSAYAARKGGWAAAYNYWVSHGYW